MATINVGFSSADLTGQYWPLDVIQASASTGGINNFTVNSTTRYIVCNGAAPIITGLTGGRQGRQVIIHYIGAGTLQITHQDTSSTAANRIINANGLTKTLAPDRQIQLFYDNAVSRWRSMDFAASILPIATYTPTLANVSNTVTKTTVLSFVIPANSMTSGDVINISMASLDKNASGGAVSVTAAVQVGAGAEAQIQSSNWSNDASEYTNIRGVGLMRVGANVWVLGNVSTIASVGGWIPWEQHNNARGTVGISTPANFTSDITVQLKITFGAANAATYLKPQAATIAHFKQPS